MKNFTCFHEHLSNRCLVRKKQLLILLTFCISVIGYAQQFTVNFITYQITSTTTNTVRTQDYNVAGGTSVIIPSTVVDSSTNIVYTVNEIGVSSFSSNNLTSVTIPNSVTSIGGFSFSDNQNLANVPLHDGITSIGIYAFVNCGLTTVNIPLGISTIEDGVFAANPITSVMIPSNVITLGDYVFNNNTNLASAQLHNGITSIGRNAFNNCNLSSINIPTGITTIEQFTFAFNNIGNVTIPDNVVSIGNSAFENNQIASLSITPNTVTNISAEAFRSNQITNLVIPNGVTDIGSAAFANNVLTSIDIADSVTFIDEYAFQINNISSFDDVVLPIGFTDIPEGLFYDNQFVNLVFPNTITSIGSRAFQLNSGLTTVRIPNNVNFIDDRAFADSSLTDVYSEATLAPSIITGGTLDTFAADRSNIHLHIPAGTMGAYVTDPGALWTGFNPVTEDALSTPEFALAYDIKVITTINGLEIISNNSINLENYTIYSITGAKVKDGTESTIATTAFSSGIYILKLDFDKGSLIKKIAIN